MQNATCENVKWLSEEESCKLLNIKVKTLKDKCRNGEFNYKIERIGTKNFYYCVGLSDKNNHYFETDLLISEKMDNTTIHRIVIEVKYNDFNSHEVITYASKSKKHKLICPYLQYGFLVINGKENIPLKLFNHGMDFDFVYMYRDNENIDELFNNIIQVCIENSKKLEAIIKNVNKNRLHLKKKWFRKDFLLN